MRLFTLILMFISFPAAAADRVLLNNGDRLSGTVTATDAIEGLTFQPSFGGEIIIPWDQVGAIQNAAGEPVAFTVPVPAPAPALTVEELAATEPAAGMESRAYEWSGRANLGMSLDDGNSNKKSVSSDAELIARNPDNRWTLTAEVNYAEDEGEETTNDQQADIQYDHFWTEKWFYGARAGFEIDKIEALDLRTRVGPFVGYQPYEREDLSLAFRLGVDYLREEFEGRDTEDSLAGVFATDYEQELWRSIRGFHNNEFTVPTDDADGFLFDSKTGFRVPVADGLTGTFEVDFDWNNDPAEGLREEDTSYNIKLGYEW